MNDFDQKVKDCNDRADVQYAMHPEDPYGNGYIACLVELGLRPAAVASTSVEDVLNRRMKKFHDSLCPMCHGTMVVGKFVNGMRVTIMCPLCQSPEPEPLSQEDE